MKSLSQYIIGFLDPNVRDYSSIVEQVDLAYHEILQSHFENAWLMIEMALFWAIFGYSKRNLYLKFISFGFDLLRMIIGA